MNSDDGMSQSSAFLSAGRLALGTINIRTILILVTLALLSAGSDQTAFADPGDKGQKTGVEAKVDLVLSALHRQAQVYRGINIQGTSESTSLVSQVPVSEGFVTIDAVAAGEAQNLMSDMEGLGARGVTIAGSMVSGRFPISAVGELAALDSLKFARPSYFVVDNVISQGDVAMKSDVGRDLYDVDGSGVTIGVLSDSFDCRGGADNDVAAGDLPSGVVVLEELPNCSFGSDEGRALMQIIHDVAPGSNLMFNTAAIGQAAMAQGIKDLAAAGADVIVDDIIYLAEPMFQDGLIAQAVDEVASEGVSYFSAAGNFARDSYESEYVPGRTFESVDFPSAPSWPGSFHGGKAHDFDPGLDIDVFQDITIPEGSVFLCPCSGTRHFSRSVEVMGLRMMWMFICLMPPVPKSSRAAYSPI